MNYRAILLEVLRSMRANLTRTILTMIGIVIGIGAVVAIMSTADSVTLTVSSEMEKSGLNKISIGPQYNGGQSRKLDDNLIAFLESLSVPGVKSYEGEIYTSSQAKDISTGETMRIFLNGATEKTIANYNLEILSGRAFISDEENISQSRVLIVDTKLTKQFFNDDPGSALGQTVKIQGVTFKIIGVYKTISVFADYASGIVPMNTLLREPFNNYGFNEIKVVIDPGVEADNVRIHLLEALLKEGGFSDEKKADFRISNPRHELDTFRQFMTAATVIIALIAAISLVVGGVGIMNIMLVTVTERTKEIGLMRSLGAKKRDIVRQFLIESITLTVFGGIIGVLLGITFAYATITIINMFDEMPNFIFTISLPGIVVSLFVSVLIGLIFGAYPATRASRLSPVEALRRE